MSVGFLVESESEKTMTKNDHSNQSSSLITIIVILVFTVLVLSLAVGYLLARNTLTPIPTATLNEATLQIIETPTLPRAFTITPKLDETKESTLVVPSSTIQPGLPQSYTATPRSIELFITNEIATQKAREEIPNNVLANPSVYFSSDNMKITGDVTIPVSNSTGVAEIIGVPEITGERLVFNVSSATVNGEDLPEILVLQIEEYINNIFADFLRGLRIQSYELENGSLKLNAIEQK